MEGAVAAAGEIDVLVNNFGDSMRADLVALPEGAAPEASDEEIARNVDVNLMHVIHCTRAIGPRMIERRRGKVVNVSSVGGPLAGVEHYSVSCAAKAGVAGFTRSLAREWAPYGICVNGIAPGLFPDPLSHTPEQIESYSKMGRGAPLAPTGALRDVGLLALYLASDASNYMTGQTIALDGGGSA